MDKPIYNRARRATRTALSLGAAASLVAACSSGHKQAAVTTTLPPTTPASTVPPTTTTTQPPPTFPLTGEPAGNNPQAKAPAVVIKIDNVDQARPQTGIDFADIVYDCEVEGGLTRLAAVFQSNYPTDVGPVRSGRLTDAGVADDLNHPVLVFAGTNAMFMPVLAAQPVTLVDDSNHPSLFSRVGSNAPHNLYSTVAGLGAASTTHSPPQPLFRYLKPGQAFGGTGVAPAAGISINFPAASATWSYDAATGRWNRTQDGTPDMLSDGKQVSAKNVVVYFVTYITSGIASGEGVPDAPIPEGILTGTGAAWFLSDGKIVKGTWKRPGNDVTATFTDSGGRPMALPPGQTWVELVPNGVVPPVTP